MLDLPDRVNGTAPIASGPIALPKTVAVRLVDYNRRIQALMDARDGYLRGVLDALGVANAANVCVDLDAFTYTVQDEA